MGFTGLARWVNASTTGLQQIKENILTNHNAKQIAKWYLSAKSYRSTLGQIPGQLPVEKTMCALTMNENVFVLLEDPVAPTRTDILTADPDNTYLQNPTHFRTTYLTLNPPGALESLMGQLKVHWIPVRHTTSNFTAQRGQSSPQQLTIEGFIFSIGSDWLVRVGNVILAGGAVKGMLLEAEYLPLPTLHSPIADGTSELLSNLLTSILPNLTEAKTVAVTISDAQWEDVLWDREEEEKLAAEPEESRDIYVYGDEEPPKRRRRDWTGLDRDRRSAFLIIGALKSEGIL